MCLCKLIFHCVALHVTIMPQKGEKHDTHYIQSVRTHAWKMEKSLAGWFFFLGGGTANIKQHFLLTQLFFTLLPPFTGYNTCGKLRVLNKSPRLHICDMFAFKF